MPSYKKPKQIDNHTPIQDYLKAVDFYKNRLWRIIGGKLEAFHENQWVAAKEFDAKFKPRIPVVFYFAKENSDKTKRYLH